MANDVIQRMQHHLDAMTQGVPGENIEFWYARDLQEPLGYARWENFMTAIFVASRKWSLLAAVPSARSTISCSPATPATSWR